MFVLPEHEQVSVSINTAGARGPERPTAKPADVRRILVFGGSNVFGAMLRDDETWPARLERELNRHEAGRYEVWNFGVLAHVPEQTATLARGKCSLLDPDLVLFAPSNLHVKPFLTGQKIEDVLAESPEMWPELFTEKCLHPAFLP